MNSLNTIKLRNFSIKSVAESVFSRMNTRAEMPSPKDKSSEIRKANVLTLSDIERFALKCKKEYPTITQYSVCCEILDTSAEFRFTQLMLDRDGNAVKDADSSKIVGRIVVASKMDVALHSAIKGVLPTEFKMMIP